MINGFSLFPNENFSRRIEFCEHKYFLLWPMFEFENCWGFSVRNHLSNRHMHTRTHREWDATGRRVKWIFYYYYSTEIMHHSYTLQGTLFYILRAHCYSKSCSSNIAANFAHEGKRERIIQLFIPIYFQENSFYLHSALQGNWCECRWNIKWIISSLLCYFSLMNGWRM